MQHSPKPWQQVTALVSLSASGTIAGLSFVPKAVTDLTSPTSVPVRLMALEQSARQPSADDTMLRSAIVSVARYYLRMAENKTPAEMEQLIWQHDSVDGVDHGESCAAFASLTLELGAHVVGQQSWVTGGTSYPWSLQKWADVRVDPNPASPGIISVLQDAQAHGRWHPLSDGYTPLPGDWVLFDGHVEVVTSYSGGVLRTVGGDSLPNFSVNAHQYRDPLAARGVVGFVNNGEPAATRPAAFRRRPAVRGGAHASSSQADRDGAGPGRTERRETGRNARRKTGQNGRAELADVPGAAASGVPGAAASGVPGAAASGVPGAAATDPPAARPGRPDGAAAVPGAPAELPGREPAGGSSAAGPGLHDRRAVSPRVPAGGTDAEQAFIREVAAGALASQRRYGVPAAVTIAQAIQESDWGRSELATRDHNLFGIKGSGPAGSDALATQEYANGRWIRTIAPFRAYHTVAESLDDHGRLLATSGYYKQAMAERHDPDAFASGLTGVYATDPHYGARLIALMRQYDLYRYDAAATGRGLPRVPEHSVPRSRKQGVPRAGEHSVPRAREQRLPQVRQPLARSRGGAPRGHMTERVRSGEAAIPGPMMPSGPAAALGPGPAPPDRRPQTLAPRRPAVAASRYRMPIPPSIRSAFVRTAKIPLMRHEPLYRDVASHRGIRWELLAACDWMQCEARSRYSPVHGEKLGVVNSDGTCYRTKSEALEQCADDLVALTRAVYEIDLTGRAGLPAGDLADAFAAFRWGELLRLHRTSSMEFPYSVAGLSVAHLSMRWPDIDQPNAPDRPGGRFRRPFGAVPIVLILNYPAA